MNLFTTLGHAGLAGWLTMGLLAVLSVISWGIMMHKYAVIGQAQKRSKVFLDSFWKSKNLEKTYESTKDAAPNPLLRVFQTAYLELARLSQGTDKEGAGSLHIEKLDNIERSLRRSASSEVSRLERYLSFLATTGSTGPFIGLFGTVVGIMRSFHQIGLSGSASLAEVAPGISEALLATAFGLAAAIPAVVGYNYFNSSIRNVSTEIENFSADFLNIVKRHFVS